MPLTETDLLNTLDDPAVGWINFSLGGVVHISRHKYQVIREHIVAGNINVTNWDNSYAQYSSGEDPPMIYMQNDTSPRAPALGRFCCTNAHTPSFMCSASNLGRSTTRLQAISRRSPTASP